MDYSQGILAAGQPGELEARLRRFDESRLRTIEEGITRRIDAAQRGFQHPRRFMVRTPGSKATVSQVRTGLISTKVTLPTDLNRERIESNQLGSPAPE